MEVFIEIACRGYRVIPHYEINGYIIDLVIEGTANKLAVKCDGDIWNGSEQFELDHSRQLDLQRAGFQFWHLRGSIFYQNPQKALDSLWANLARAGIIPIEN